MRSYSVVVMRIHDVTRDLNAGKDLKRKFVQMQQKVL